MHHSHPTAHESMASTLTPGWGAVLATWLVVVLIPLAVLVLVSYPTVVVGFAAGLLVGRVARDVSRMTRPATRRLRRLLDGAHRRTGTVRRTATRE